MNTKSPFQDWWTDQENGCPVLVLNNDEEFAIAVWNAAIKYASECVAPGGDRDSILSAQENEKNI